MFVETTPDVSSSFTNVKKRASAAGYAVNKILRLAGKIVTDGKETLRASYVCDGTDVITGIVSRTLTREGARLFGSRVIGGVDQHVPRRRRRRCLSSLLFCAVLCSTPLCF